MLVPDNRNGLTESKPIRAYPNNPAALRAIRAQAKCRKAM